MDTQWVLSRLVPLALTAAGLALLAGWSGEREGRWFSALSRAAATPLVAGAAAGLLFGAPWHGLTAGLWTQVLGLAGNQARPRASEVTGGVVCGAAVAVAAISIGGFAGSELPAGYAGLAETRTAVFPSAFLAGLVAAWVVVPIPFFRRQESPLVFAVAGGVVTLALVVPAAIFVRYAGGGSPLDQPGTFAPLAAAAGLAMLAGTRGRALASPARRVEDGAVTLFPVLSGVLYLQASGAAGAVAAPPPAVWLWAAVTVAGAAFGLSAARPARVVGLALTMVACLLWAVR